VAPALTADMRQLARQRYAVLGIVALIAPKTSKERLILIAYQKKNKDVSTQVRIEVGVDFSFDLALEQAV